MKFSFLLPLLLPVYISISSSSSSSATATVTVTATRLRKLLASSLIAPMVVLTTISTSIHAEEASIGPNLNTIPSNEIVPSQLAPPNKVDINAATVDAYKKFPGMFPHAAGQIASHGPYSEVNDLFKINTATQADRALFLKYMKDFTALPPGRMFGERLNARQSQ